MGSESLLTFGEIRRKPGYYCNVEWGNRQFKVDAAGNVSINDVSTPGEWINLSPHPSAWGTPEREFYSLTQEDRLMAQVYEDQNGHLYYEVAKDVWLFDANRGSLDRDGKTCGTIIPGHTVDRSKLTPLDGVSLGFHGVPKPRIFTFAEILRKPGVYDDEANPDSVVTVNSIRQAFVVDKKGVVVRCQPSGWDTPERRFKPSNKKIEVK